MKFNNAIQVILQHEGGYVNDRHDPGGETNYGISKRAFPDVDIKNLTELEAKRIYRENYWDKILGDEINDYNVALQIFDMAVNAGVVTASKMVQRIVNASPDGVIGLKTIAAINSYQKDLLVANYKFERLKYYVSIVIAKPVQVKFLKSWLNRI